MRSFLLLSLALLALVQLTSAAQIANISFWSDSTCSTTPIDITTLGLSETAQWPNIPRDSVYDVQGPPCANVTNLGSIQSGTYECLSGMPGVGGLLVLEYTALGCAGSPAVIYEFLGDPSGTCNNGSIEVISSTGVATYNMFANVVCLNQSTVAPSSTGTVVAASSSGASAASGASGATAVVVPSSSGTVNPPAPGNGAAERVSASAALFAAVVLAVLISL